MNLTLNNVHNNNYNNSKSDSDDDNNNIDIMPTTNDVTDLIDPSNIVGKIGAALIIAMIVCGSVGNILVFLVVVRIRRLRRSYNFFIASLSVTDLLFNCAIMPFYADTYLHREWRHGVRLCRFHAYFGTMLIMSSSLHIALIAINRYFLIVQTSLYPKVSGIAVLALQVVCVWAVSLVAVLPGALGWHAVVEYTDQIGRCTYVRSESKDSLYMVFCLGFIFPCLVMCVCYALIWVKTRRTENKLDAYQLHPVSNVHHPTPVCSNFILSPMQSQQPLQSQTTVGDAVHKQADLQKIGAKLSVSDAGDIAKKLNDLAMSRKLRTRSCCLFPPIKSARDPNVNNIGSSSHVITSNSPSTGASDEMLMRSWAEAEIISKSASMFTAFVLAVDGDIRIKPDATFFDHSKFDIAHAQYNNRHRNLPTTCGDDVIASESKETSGKSDRSPQVHVMPSGDPYKSENGLGIELSTLTGKEKDARRVKLTLKLSSSPCLAHCDDHRSLETTPSAGHYGNLLSIPDAREAPIPAEGSNQIGSPIDRHPLQDHHHTHHHRHRCRHHHHAFNCSCIDFSIPCTVHINSSQIQKPKKRHRHPSLRIMLAIFLAFVSTYLPFTVINLVDEPGLFHRNWYMITSLGFWAGSCVNPVIYGVMNKQFRNAYCSIISACLSRRRNTMWWIASHVLVCDESRRILVCESARRTGLWILAPYWFVTHRAVLVGESSHRTGLWIIAPYWVVNRRAVLVCESSRRILVCKSLRRTGLWITGL